MLALPALLLAGLPIVSPPTTPLPAAHAHNDYEHTRPLFDALARGFCTVEADVWLKNDALLVSHLPFNLKADRTLQKLYLDPLRKRAKQFGGHIYPDGTPFSLMIDVKSDAKTGYAALHKVLEEYADILTVVRDGKVEAKAVTVVISGNRDREAMEKQAVRYALLDGRPGDLESDAPAHLIPWVSDAWKNHFTWDGTGEMPAAERAKLRAFVAKAHGQGRQVRFWATPETVALWKELHAAECDRINTDKLDALRDFMLDVSKTK